MSDKAPALILYAEDDPDDAFFMRRAFTKANLDDSLHVVTNGAEAIVYLEGDGKQALPRFVILDIKMPRVSGLEVLSWIRTNLGKPLPIFMLSSSSQDRDIQQAVDLGANGYLLKPSNAGRLADALRFIREFCEDPGNLERGWVQFDGSTAVSVSKASVQVTRNPESQT